MYFNLVNLCLGKSSLRKLNLMFLSGLALAISLGFSFTANGAEMRCSVNPNKNLGGTVIIREGVTLASSEQSRLSLFLTESMTFDLLGQQKFIKTEITANGNTKLDFVHEKMRGIRAVLLAKDNPGKLYEKSNFDATLVVTGLDLSGSADNEPVFSFSSLVFDLTCRQ